MCYLFVKPFLFKNIDEATYFLINIRVVLFWIEFLEIISQLKKDEDILHLSSDLQRAASEVELNMWSRRRDYPCIYVQA